MSQKKALIIKNPGSFKQKLALRTYLFLINLFSNYKAKLKEALIRFKLGLAGESEQTKQMLKIYLRRTQGKVDPEEMKEANKQFVDLFKGAGLGVMLFLPFSPITLPFIIKLGEKMGVDVLPDSFRNFTNNDNNL